MDFNSFTPKEKLGYGDTSDGRIGFDRTVSIPLSARNASTNEPTYSQDRIFIGCYGVHRHSILIDRLRVNARVRVKCVYYSGNFGYVYQDKYFSSCRLSFFVHLCARLPYQLSRELNSTYILCM